MSTRTGSVRLGAAGRYALLIVAAGISLAPLVWMMASAFKPGGDIIARPFSFDAGRLTLHNFRAMLETIPIGTGFRNTAIVVVLKGTLTMIFCPMAGFAFAKYAFPGKRLLFGTVLTTLMLPTLVLLIPLLLEMSQLGWVSTFQALILPGAIDAFGVFWMRQVIMAIPDELLDAARVDGAGELRIFASIVLPVIRPGLAALGVLSFINIYNDFVWPVVAVNDEQHQTLQVMLSALAQNIRSGQLGADWTSVWGQLLAASTVAAIPVLAVFIVLQRHLIKGVMAGSLKG
ncbi:carbohydrate ABC transporter membrane protein 2 (CUT1 family) [Kribbella voronezhensis]|uniref:Carbohydrate ABC transporter membrane protein 2 (CUT1 family) n=1 Tax=Kribbella voronezhensis TaxID=2512212 RepID=A0A4R7T9R8_9ACTN|nr:carbohydrate ABC transporter permease [Kribbella voronezhensis]TDU87947.1 carbohydrate ABC transporter membrane protein 2 (CUT1 family) [Kribbella voronezhensis]